jgi:outer membrane protein assembly factor BamB
MLRLWPGVLIVAIQWIARFVLPAVAPDFTSYGVLAGLAGGPALIVWWLFFSRVAWSERIGALLAMAAAIAATWPFLDVSITTGAMGALFPMLAMPLLCLALVLWAGASRRMLPRARLVSLVAAMMLASGVWALVRTGGFTGSFDNDLAWRWTPTPEERLIATDVPLAAAPVVEAAPISTAAPLLPADAPNAERHEAPAPVRDGWAEWPGFRGRNRDGVVRDLQIDTNWSAAPPVELWRRAIGPGWSSFSASGDLIYTQEQRGDEELVAAYRLSTGAPVWQHRDTARFWESNGGAGPRGTPTFHEGRLYALGATGILNALDAGSGRVLWTRNVETDSQVKVPDWGFSSSPLIVDSLVIVAAAGTLVAYDRGTGALRWVGPNGGAGYSSPHEVTIDGVRQVLLLDGHGATSVAPTDGSKLWELALTASAMSSPIVQPATTPEGDLLISSGNESGLTRVSVSRQSGVWTVATRWHSNRLKPSFNDFVVHNGYAFGFDGAMLASIDLADGSRKWKGGRYGNGQLMLLADQDLLLVTSEEGALALVEATAAGFTEVASVPAIEGKTWNHPVLVGDVLVIRNGQEMAAFRLMRSAATPAPGARSRKD